MDSIEQQHCGRTAAAGLFKALSHADRLTILWHLTQGEKSVNKLEKLMGIRQAAVSQHLARLRQDGLVQRRREGKLLYYSVDDERVRRAVDLASDLYPPQENLAL